MKEDKFFERFRVLCAENSNNTQQICDALKKDELAELLEKTIIRSQTKISTSASLKRENAINEFLPKLQSEKLIVEIEFIRKFIRDNDLKSSYPDVHDILIAAIWKAVEINLDNYEYERFSDYMVR